MILIIRTLTLNPLIGIIIATLLQTVLMVGLILNLHKLRINQPLISGIKKFLTLVMRGLFSVIGILLIDIALFWLLGSWTYNDWKFQLPSVIIILIIGIEFELLTLFPKGNLIDILYFIISTLVIVLFIHWWVPMEPVMGPGLETYLPIILGALVLAYILKDGIKYGVQKKNLRVKSLSENNSENIPENNLTQISKNWLNLWDAAEKFEKFFNFKFNLICWVIATLQSLLILNGFSLFSIF